MKQTTLRSISLFILLIVAAVTRAQYSGIFFTPGIAIGKSTLPELPFPDRPLTGFDGGIGAEYGISKKISLQAELNYSVQGARLVDDSTGEFLKLQTSYLTLPVLVKYYFSQGFSVFAGPQFSYLLAARQLAHGANSHTTLDIKHFYKSTDICLVAGLEYRFPAGLLFSLRYNYGLTDIDHSLIGIIQDNKQKNRYFSFRMGYSIPFSRLMQSNAAK
jgi:hypothetical protein